MAPEDAGYLQRIVLESLHRALKIENGFDYHYF